MASENSVALAALVVGLVALLVASGQLIQQMFSTADGYRRCKGSVIGAWSKKTRLVWHWNQFRFETRFTTPEIVLYHWRVLQMVKSRNGGVTPEVDGRLQGIIALDSPDLPYELRETIRPSRSDSVEYGNGDMVSWTSLLRQLYSLQSKWYQTYHNNRLPPSDPAQVVGYATKIGVIYRERTWDLMPPDSIRPMASSRLGTVIVLAIRLGMTWENLDVGGGLLRAEGNGHTLLSTMMRGFGIVFQYNFNPDTDLPRQLMGHASSSTQGRIPRRSTDMLACGIIPGLPLLYIPAMPLRGKTVAESASLISSALLCLNIPRSTVAKVSNLENLRSMQQDGFGSPVGWPINDFIALTSPFQPLKGSTKTQSVYPIETTIALSVFLIPQSRKVLLDELKNCPQLQDANRTHLRDVCDRFSSLAQNYSGDFYCTGGQDVVNDMAASIDTKIKFIEYLREIHDWTIDYFKKIELQLRYIHLVAAHITLATNAGFESNERANTLFTQEYWKNTARAYVRHLDQLTSELIQDFPPSQQGSDGSNLIIDAWWTLILRGVVWRMSIYFSHQETVVPSRLYYDQTPVYIL